MRASVYGMSMIQAREGDMWVSERASLWNVSPYKGICIVRDTLVHVPKRTRHIEVLIVANVLSQINEILDHGIISDRKDILIYRDQPQCGASLLGEYAVGYPQRHALLELFAYFQMRFHG